MGKLFSGGSCSDVRCRLLLLMITTMTMMIQVFVVKVISPQLMPNAQDVATNQSELSRAFIIIIVIIIIIIIIIIAGIFRVA